MTPSIVLHPREKQITTMTYQDDNKYEKHRRQLRGTIYSIFSFAAICLVVAAIGFTVANHVEAGHPAAKAIQRHLGTVKKVAHRHLDKWKAPPSKPKLSQLRGVTSGKRLHRREMQRGKGRSLDARSHHTSTQHRAASGDRSDVASWTV